MDIEKKKIAVVGLGVSGLAAVNFLLDHGAEIYVSEKNKKEDVDRRLLSILESRNVQFEFGGHSREFLSRCEMIFLSPGVPQLKLFRELSKTGIKLVGELSLMIDYLTVPVIGITGTNGKTTVTSLVSTIFTVAGKKVFTGGNIGTPVFELRNKRDDVDLAVLELSSFQLDYAGDFPLQMALLLNITPDHLDRHGDMGGYAESKGRIFSLLEENGYAIGSEDDSFVKSRLEKVTRQKKMTFGFGKDSTARISDNSVILSWQGEEEVYSLQDTKLCTVSGKLNSSAAILACRAMGCGKEQIVSGLKEFSPLAHRLEFVKKVNGVSYYNDSKATNTGAVLNALSQFEKDVILIAGGRDKGDDFGLLRQEVENKVKKLILVGEAAEKIEEKLAGSVPVQKVLSMAGAVAEAAKCGKKGDVVLLSPACASFDMYKSYNHRGDDFKRIVNGI